MDINSTPRGHANLTRAQRITGAVFGLIVAGLFTYSVMGSYETITALARKYEIPYPEFAAAGIDGGLLGVVLLDLWITWIGYPVGWIRLMARFFTAGTVVVNAVGGWHDDLAEWETAIPIGLHVFAPMLLMVFVESAHAVLMRVLRDERGKIPDPIPAMAWVLQGWPTFLVWRRMKLSGIDGASEARAFEAKRRRAIARLRMAHPGGFWIWARWRKAVARELVYDLLRGYNLDDAVKIVDSMRLSGTPGAPPSGAGRGTPSASSPEPPAGNTSANGQEPPTRNPPANGRSGNGSRSGNPADGKSANPRQNPPSRPIEDMTEEQRFDARMALIEEGFPTDAPGLAKLRTLLQEHGMGVGVDKARELQAALCARRGILLPKETVGAAAATSGD